MSVSRPESFLIEATPLRLHLDVLSTLNAFPGVVQPITSRHLHASTNDPNQTRPVMFTVRSQPRLGRLVGGEDEDETLTTFSQAAVNTGLVGYQHTAAPAETAWSQTDSFVFDVTTEYVDSPLVSRLFTISVSYDHVNHDNIHWLMTLGTTSVQEGCQVIIDKSVLDVTSLQRRFTDAVDVDTAAAVRYIIADPPRHGTLQLVGLNLSIAGHFSQQEVDAGELVYQHDGSDTISDHFTFSLDLVHASVTDINLDDPPQTFNFNITVVSVDDQPFRLMTMSPQIDLVQGSVHVITRDALLTQDDDTPPWQIIYEVSIPPTNGHLQNSDLLPTDDVMQFTQLDVNQLKISFVSDGTLNNSAFYFHVSDGVHKPLYKVTGDLLFRLPTPAESFGLGRMFESVCLSVCLSVCPEHNSKTKDPKVFKHDIRNDLAIS